jgi:hypothetical protein
VLAATDKKSAESVYGGNPPAHDHGGTLPNTGFDWLLLPLIVAVVVVFAVVADRWSRR